MGMSWIQIKRIRYQKADISSRPHYQWAVTQCLSSSFWFYYFRNSRLIRPTIVGIRFICVILLAIIFSLIWNAPVAQYGFDICNSMRNISESSALAHEWINCFRTQTPIACHEHHGPRPIALYSIYMQKQPKSSHFHFFHFISSDYRPNVFRENLERVDSRMDRSCQTILITYFLWTTDDSLERKKNGWIFLSSRLVRHIRARFAHKKGKRKTFCVKNGEMRPYEWLTVGSMENGDIGK